MGLKSKVKKAGRFVLSNLGRPVRVEQSLRGESALLSGRCVVVTGAASGIGFATAAACLRAGADVVVTSRSLDRAKDACGRLGGGHPAALDLSDAGSMAAQVDALYGAAPAPVDALVNNAGVLKGAAFGRTAVADFDEVVGTNLRGTYFLTQEVARRMVKEGLKGNICFVTSSSAYRPATNAYSCTKWALRGLTEGAAKMLAPHGIVVNAVAPGPTATAMLLEGDAGNVMLPRSPIGRYVTPEEIAEMVVTLLSDASRSVIGDTVRMTGGSGVVTFDDADATFEL